VALAIIKQKKKRRQAAFFEEAKSLLRFRQHFARDLAVPRCALFLEHYVESLTGPDKYFCQVLELLQQNDCAPVRVALERLGSNMAQAICLPTRPIEDRLKIAELLSRIGAPGHLGGLHLKFVEILLYKVEAETNPVEIYPALYALEQLLEDTCHVVPSQLASPLKGLLLSRKWKERNLFALEGYFCWLAELTMRHMKPEDKHELLDSLL
jgi:hypothetical protein